MRRKFSELEAKMSPESRARVEARTKEMMATMQRSLIEGEQSGKADYSLDQLIEELDDENQ